MSRFGLRPPPLLLVSFLAVTLLPACAILWLGWRFFEQDRALSAQRLRDRQEQAADLIVVALQQATDQPGDAPAADAVSITFDSDRIVANPKLLYYPVAPALRQAPAEPFARAEELEFRQQNYEGAAAALADLTRSSNAGIRAGAHLRMARNLRKAGRLDAALAEYADLARFGGISLDGIPADLVGRRARLALLSELKRPAEAQRDAQSMASDLELGLWILTRATFLHYAQEAGYRPAAKRLAEAEAVEWIWEKRIQAAAGKESAVFEGRQTTMVWRDNRALIAGPAYVEQHWLGPLKPLLASQDVRLTLGEGAASGSIERDRSITHLPWIIAVASADPAADLKDFTARRRFLLLVLGVLAALVGGGSYAIIRAVNRELAAARLQSEFVAAVSHEFRTPLTLLRQVTEVFTENRVADESQRQSYYRLQSRATDRLHRLVESLLDFRRMEAGAKPYRFQPLDPALLVQKVVGEFQSETAGNGYGVELSVRESVPAVDGDSDALTHAVWNLLDNAVKYSPQHQAVWVDVGRQGDGVAIAVRDRGMGIPANEQKAVFQKFVRGAAARLHEIKGTGIGLAMVSSIVQAHGGRVLLESAPGVGSTFTIVLPVGKGVCPES